MSSIECPICHDHFGSKRVKELMGCGHRFHKRCIDGWLKNHDTCPFRCGVVDTSELPKEGCLAVPIGRTLRRIVRCVRYILVGDFG